MSEEEHEWLTSTLHALDHASRLVETAREVPDFGGLASDPEDVPAAELCADAMRYTIVVAKEVAGVPADRLHTETVAALRGLPEAHHTGQSSGEPAVAADDLLIRLERCAKSLAELGTSHRSATLNGVASRALRASEAIARVDGMRRLEMLAHHSWRSATHLLGCGTHNRNRQESPFAQAVARSGQTPVNPYNG
jgi:phosphate:Na+ symporter